MTARRAAVLGSPIAHSLSPVLWRAAFAELDLDWTYDAVECDEERLPALLAEMAADPAWACVSLTMPLKHRAADVVDEHRAPVRPVNTVVFEAGRTIGHNTDLDGVVAAVRELGAAPERTVVLGAGGTAAAAVAALADLGSDVVCVARRPDQAAAICKHAAPWAQAGREISKAELVIATTPRGATDRLAAAPWPRRADLVEVLYDPWPTPLAAAALAAGARVAGGLTVLVGQAAAAIRLVTGCEPPVSAMRTAGEAALAARHP